MDNTTKKEEGQREILACNEEISKELFSKELHIIVTDGVRNSMDKQEN
ncbi:hypothetical protein [Sutcliffiella deserti]|nr:hypothetical protein [Sutcliffiella deserti]